MDKFKQFSEFLFYSQELHYLFDEATYFIKRAIQYIKNYNNDEQYILTVPDYKHLSALDYNNILPFTVRNALINKLKRLYLYPNLSCFLEEFGVLDTDDISTYGRLPFLQFRQSYRSSSFYIKKNNDNTPYFDENGFGTVYLRMTEAFNQKYGKMLLTLEYSTDLDAFMFIDNNVSSFNIVKKVESSGEEKVRITTGGLTI